MSRQGQGQCKVKVRSRQGQGKVNASSMQGKAKIKARSSKVKASLRQGQGIRACSWQGQGEVCKVKARSRRGQPLIGETNFLGRDQDREIRLIKTYYETKTEK